MSIINQNEPYQVSQTPVHLLHALGAADTVVRKLCVRLAQEGEAE
jgi:hypothetical protein